MATTNKNFIVKNGLDANGDISTTGQVNVNYSAGDEGGQIFLNKPVTNTTISGGVNIDIYQNRLRFFENTGTNRGFYIDITTGTGAAGTNLAAGSGTVTSVGLTVPTGLSVSGSPITGSGTLAISLAAGYSIPTTANQTNWTTAYGWGNHSAAGYLLSSTASSTYQPLDADLTAIAALAGTSGFLKKTAANTWSLDTSTYLTGNQSISISGDASGSGTTSISLTLANSGATAGTYKSVTVDAKGRVTAGTNPTTLSGYGITDAASSTHTHGNITNDGKIGITSGLVVVTSTSGAIAALAAGTSGQYLSNNATWSTPPDTNTYPTTWTWTGGTTSGPTASITGTSSTISVAAVPAASSTASGIVTTGSQNFAGTKTFDGAIWVGGSAVNISSTGAYAGVSISTTGNITSGGALIRSALAGGGSTGATFNDSGSLVRTTSSLRYKQNVKAIDYPYNEILLLQPKTFRLKEEVKSNPDARTYGGFIAEDLDQIESLKVFVNYLPQEDGSKIPDGINYGEMVSALVSAIKYQDGLIKSLTSRIEALENR